jgi:glycosyltransferase involved in cell wall biosynthesis
VTSLATEPDHAPRPTTDDRPLRVLFVKDGFAWPRASGHDIHTYYLLKALSDAGHETALAVFKRPDPRAVEGVPDDELFVFGESSVPVPPAGQFPLKLTKLQEKFRGYWGTDADRVRWVAAVADRFAADAVVVVGLGVLPYLGACPERVCVWYAADEWAWHHLSFIRPFRPSSWSEFKPAFVKCVYERAFRPLLDRTWVVSEADKTAFRWFAGYTKTDLIHYGADTAFYAPGDEPQVPNSCAFWGRLDFEPNVQALEWFCGTIWPTIRSRVPDATFAIYGFQPTPPVSAFHGRDGITVTPNVPDIRPAVRKHPVVVLPFVSGGGVKNKLLEASGMAKAVVGTARVRNGLKGDLPFLEVKTPGQWADAVVGLWRDGAKRESLGRAARAWVCEHHTWAAAADEAAAGIRAALVEKRTRSKR